MWEAEQRVLLLRGRHCNVSARDTCSPKATAELDRIRVFGRVVIWECIKEKGGVFVAGLAREHS